MHARFLIFSTQRLPWLEPTVSCNEEGDTRKTKSSLQWYQPSILAPGGSRPTKSAILGARQLPAKSLFSAESVFGVVPLFTWGAGADGFKMASRWWQGLDCGRSCSLVPAHSCVSATGVTSLYLHRPTLFFSLLQPSLHPSSSAVGRTVRLFPGRPPLPLSRIISAIAFPLFSSLANPPLFLSLLYYAPSPLCCLKRAAHSPAAALVRCLCDVYPTHELKEDSHVKRSWTETNFRFLIFSPDLRGKASH